MGSNASELIGGIGGIRRSDALPRQTSLSPDTAFAGRRQRLVFAAKPMPAPAQTGIHILALGPAPPSHIGLPCVLLETRAADDGCVFPMGLVTLDITGMP